jgi:hypothetical protein
MAAAVIGVLVVVGLVWLHIAADRAEKREAERDMKAIARLPPDMQVRLWAARCRQQADRDRF